MENMGHSFLSLPILLAVFMLLKKIEISWSVSSIKVSNRDAGLTSLAWTIIFSHTFDSRNSLRQIFILWTKSARDSAPWGFSIIGCRGGTTPNQLSGDMVSDLGFGQGFWQLNYSDGIPDQPFFQIEVILHLGHSSVPCSILDIRFSRWNRRISNVEYRMSKECIAARGRWWERTLILLLLVCCFNAFDKDRDQLIGFIDQGV